MVREHMKRLVLDVVLSQADAEEVFDVNSDTIVLEVDQLTMTHIVLELETQLGVELPTYLEDARTVAELVTGALEALQRHAHAGIEAEKPLDRQQAMPLTSAANTPLS